MTLDIVTIFQAMIEQPLAAGIIGRAIERGTLDVKVRDLRDFTTDRHRVVDDEPYGGGPGMVLKPDPIFRALDAIEAERGRPLTVILTSPQGARFTQAVVRVRLKRLDVDVHRQHVLVGDDVTRRPRGNVDVLPQCVHIVSAQEESIKKCRFPLGR